MNRYTALLVLVLAIVASAILGGAGPNPTRPVALPSRAIANDGSRDVSEDLQRMIDSAIKPLGSIRVGATPVVLPPGILRIDKPLRIANVESFVLSAPCSRIVPGRKGMTCLLDLDGVSYGSFSDLRFDAGPGDCQRVIHLHKSARAARTTMNTLQNVHIGGLKYVEGIAIGEPGSLEQEDHTTLVGCTVAGQQQTQAGKPAETAWWQTGYTIGSGRFANNLVHTALGCHSYNNRRNWAVGASQLALTGGGVGGAEVDFYVCTTSYVSITGIRSEGSRRLLDTYGPVKWSANVSLSDVCFRAENLAEDGQLVRWLSGGHLSLRSLYIIAPDLSRLRIAHGGEGPATVSVDGLSIGQKAPDPKALFAGWGTYDLRGYHQMGDGGEAL